MKFLILRLLCVIPYQVILIFRSRINPWNNKSLYSLEFWGYTILYRVNWFNNIGTITEYQVGLDV